MGLQRLRNLTPAVSVNIISYKNNKVPDFLTGGYFAFKGSGKFTIKSTSGTFNEFYIDCAYAHYTISATPNISISDGKTNLSISFKGGLNDDMHIKRIYNASFNIVEDY